MMTRITEDFALLDLGEEEKNRFVAITGIAVDDAGHLVAGIDIGKILSDEAVRKGATRIEHSHCVDTSTGGEEAENDRISVYNGGDKFLADATDEATIFLVGEGLLEKVAG